MTKLPDLEAMAIFVKIAEFRSFARAAEDLSLSKPTVSKAVGRLEAKLGTRLINRTSRRLSLTDAGRSLAARAAAMLAEAETAESEALSQSSSPRGLVRLAAPMSFGVLYMAPLLPDFFRAYPDVTIDLHLDDRIVDIVGEGYDAAIRIAEMPDSSLVARRLCEMPIYLLASPSYLKAHGRPKHPLDLARHAGLAYAYQLTDVWRFTKKNGETASVRPSGPLRVNNGEAMLPSLVAGVGIGALPEFIVRETLRSKKLEIVLPDWSLAGAAVHWVTPPKGPKPKRVEALGEFLAQRLARKAADERRGKTK